MEAQSKGARKNSGFYNEDQSHAAIKPENVAAVQ
jgi:hypothetical protein